MKKLEKVLAIIIFIGAVLKLIGIPGGSLLFVVGISTLCCVYHPLGFVLLNNIQLTGIFKKTSYAGISGLRMLGAIGAGIALSGDCIGVMWQMQHWAGVGGIVLTGLIYTLIVLVIALIKYFKTKDAFYKWILIRMGLICVGGFLFCLIQAMLNQP